MGVNTQEVQVIALGTGRRVSEIPTFPNLAAFNTWWDDVRLQQIPPRHEGDTETVGIIHTTNGHIIRRFRTFAVGHMWANQLRVILLSHGTDVQHHTPNYGVIYYPRNLG